MEKTRTGKRDVFSSRSPIKETTPVKATIHEEVPQPPMTEKQRRGRPLEHKEEWTKVTVVLLDKQIHWLDKLSLDIRQNTKAAVSRAEIIRALIAAIDESGVDLTRSRTEHELKALVLTLIKDK